jgi:hypothetical protein
VRTTRKDLDAKLSMIFGTGYWLEKDAQGYRVEYKGGYFSPRLPARDMMLWLEGAEAYQQLLRWEMERAITLLDRNRSVTRP